MLKEALFGTQQDFTEGNLNRAIVLLAIPMILEMVMESLFGVVDVFFVARLGANAIATVGLTESLLTLIFGVAIGLSMATTAFVARRTGEKDPDGAANCAVQSILLAILVSAFVGIIGFTRAPQLLHMMGATPEIEANARYTRLMLGGSAVIFLLFLINGIFRGAGDAALAMRTLWLANGINLVLDPCLINGWGPFPHLGVFGAAVATSTGRGIGVLFQLWQLGSGRQPPHHSAGSGPPERAGDAAAAQSFFDRYYSVSSRDCELDGAGADCRGVRQCGRRRVHDCRAATDLHDSAVVGFEQRSGYARRAEPWGGEAAAGRIVGLSHRFFQHAVSRPGFAGLLVLSGAR